MPVGAYAAGRRLRLSVRELFLPAGHYTGEGIIHILAPGAGVRRDEPTDDELMAGARRGDRDSFARLFARYRKPVWGFFRRRVTDAARAEELAQDVFAALLQAVPRYEPRSTFRSYVFGIAFNVLLTDQRGLRPTTDSQQLDELPVSGADPDLVMWVQRALAALDPDDREIVMLREYEQLSYQEIAEVRGVPVNTVRSQLFRARAALRAQLLQGETKEARS